MYVALLSLPDQLWHLANLTCSEYTTKISIKDFNVLFWLCSAFIRILEGWR